MIEKNSPILLWFRLDLRLHDHPALHAAIGTGRPIIPLFIHSPAEEMPWSPGAASHWWLHHSLAALDASLRERGSRLVLRTGPSLEVLENLIEETKAGALYFCERYEPSVRARDAIVQSRLQSQGLEVQSFPGNLLIRPEAILNSSGKPFRVFTPFWNHTRAQLNPAKTWPTPQRMPAVPGPEGVSLRDLALLPRVDWAKAFSATWVPGEAGAQERLKNLRTLVPQYGETRNFPATTGTSRLSPHLHFGEVSPRQVWHAVKNAAEKEKPSDSSWKNSVFLTELGWREFAHYQLRHFPHTTDEPLREEFAHFPWRKNPEGLRAWQQGRTGYPIVDAGMRELWATGWMHNRVRMIVASFLVKDLMVSWKEGTRWFWDTLVDADLAQNTLGWQWTAGCGADAAPFFRIFNPVTQSEKFDAEGTYIRLWIPELKSLPGKWIHRPWEAPQSVLSAAQVRLDDTYPRPIISHAIAREVALEAFHRLGGSTG